MKDFLREHQHYNEGGKDYEETEKNRYYFNVVFRDCPYYDRLRRGGGGNGEGEPSPAYTIGGTVSGLSGTLALQNNSGDDLTITADAAFTFNTALADGSAYSVSILTSPVLQNCTVTNGSGTINGADVTDVSVNCADKKTWTHPLSLTDNISPDGQWAYGPKAAMDDNGNAVIVWLQDDGSFSQIFKSEYR